MLYANALMPHTEYPFLPPLLDQKSCTGTVMILIEDVNDNAPMITKPNQVLCNKDGKRGSMLLEAKDLDEKPYSDPFTFKLGNVKSGQWKLSGATGISREQALLGSFYIYMYPKIVIKSIIKTVR